MAIKINKDSIKGAIKWFVNKIKGLQKRDVTGKDVNLKKTKTFRQLSKTLLPGLIYSHVYSPKFKKTLPFYDTIPLFAVINLSPDRILAFNFHYLPPQQRKSFLDEYYNYLENKSINAGYDDINNVPKKKLSEWGMIYLNDVYLLAVSSPGNMLRACVRTYLYSHIRSRITPIEIEEYDNIYNLILPNFQKKSSSEIYEEIKNTYNKYKNNSYKNLK